MLRAVVLAGKWRVELRLVLSVCVGPNRSEGTPVAVGPLITGWATNIVEEENSTALEPEFKETYEQLCNVRG